MESVHLVPIWEAHAQQCMKFHAKDENKLKIILDHDHKDGTSISKCELETIYESTEFFIAHYCGLYRHGTEA